MARVQPTSGVDMSDLKEAWPTMAPSARRQAMRARILGADRTLYARIARMLGFAWKPAPASAKRVAARALVLAAIGARTHREQNVEQARSSDQVNLLAALKGLGVVSELERPERDYLGTPVGRADRAL